MSLSSQRRAELLAGPYTRLLSEHEKAICDLYGSFARMFPGAKLFWQAMARDESGHAALILKVEEKLMNGEWKFRRPIYTTSAIANDLTRIAVQKETIQRDGISMREALRLAIEIESGLVESKSFEIVENDTAEMMDAIRSLAGDSAGHTKMLQMEARRLKWRILGKRVVKSKATSQRSSTDLHASVKAAQGHMLGLLVSLHEATSALYNAYAERLADRSEFWSRMAAAEMQQASMLRGLYKILEKGNIFYNVDRFSRKAIEEETDVVLSSEFETHQGNCSTYNAVNTALRIERSLCKSGFYATAQSDSPEFQIIAVSMQQHLEKHIRQLEEEAGRAIDIGMLDGKEDSSSAGIEEAGATPEPTKAGRKRPHGKRLLEKERPFAPAGWEPL